MLLSQYLVEPMSVVVYSPVWTHQCRSRQRDNNQVRDGGNLMENKVILERTIDFDNFKREMCFV